MIDRMKKVLTWAGILLFIIGLGWTIPYMVILPFVRLREIIRIIATGKVGLMGNDLSMLVWPTLAIWYLFTTPTLTALFWKVPVARPGLVLAYSMAVGTTLAGHLLHVGMLQAPQWRWPLAGLAVLVVAGIRAGLSYLFVRLPAREWVPQQ